MANTYISRTFGTPTNSAIWTLSFWIKRSSLSPSTSQKIFSAGTGSTDRTEISFAGGNDGLNIYRNISGSTAGLDSTRKFRDVNAWYHIVVQNNNGTAAVYVNGEAETMSSTSLGTNKINLASTIHIFGDQVASGQNFDGLMSHIHFVDGTIYAPTVFGSTDSTTGEWQINTSPSITMGNNGFTILKDGNTITDQSANSNDFSLSSGTLTKTEDNPSNVFATLNVLASTSTPNFSNGNTSIYANTQNSWNQLTPATFVMPSGGKFYWEVKNTSSSHPNYINPGFMNANYYNNLLANSGFPGNVYDADNGFWNGMQGGGDNNTYAVYRAGTASNISISESFTNGDILSFAVDLNNRKAWLGKNGTYIQSGNPSNGTNETWSSADIDANTDYVPGIAHYYTNPSASFNFGNGYFGTTAVSSAGTNASGIGIFEYDVPTGFTALSTKGLNL